MKNLLLCLLLFVAFARVEAAELLIFTASWCGPCQALKKDLAADPETLAGREWGYVDFDNEKELAKSYDVTGVPTFLILEDNKVVRRLVGYSGLEKLKKWLNGAAIRPTLLRR